jgi:hypothetical protein
MGKYDLLLQGIQPRSIVDPAKDTESKPSQEARAGPSFDEILAAKFPAGTVKLLTEASGVLETAGIVLTPMELDRIGKAIDRLSEAGGQCGLLVSERAALMVNVPDRIITSGAARADIRDHVFTSVDSVMLLD